MDMTQRVMDAFYYDQWMEEIHKNGFQKFLDNVMHNSIWNVKNILTKYGKTHRPGDATFTDVIATADLFATCLKPFRKNRNQVKSISWWNFLAGMVEAALQRRHLVALLPTAKSFQWTTSVGKVDMRPYRGYASREYQSLNRGGSLLQNSQIKLTNRMI